MHCPLVRALAELSKGDVHDDAAALEDAFAEQVLEHKATRTHITNVANELKAHFKVPEIEDSDSYQVAMSVFKQREDQVKQQREAFKYLHKRKQQDEKDEKEAKRQQKAAAKAEPKAKKAKK